MGTFAMNTVLTQFCALAFDQVPVALVEITFRAEQLHIFPGGHSPLTNRHNVIAVE